jgi:hypothetical protein
MLWVDQDVKPPVMGNNDRTSLRRKAEILNRPIHPIKRQRRFTESKAVQMPRKHIL